MTDSVKANLLNRDLLKERIAETLALRFIERGNSRITGSCGYRSFSEMPYSYKKDFYDDADAVIDAVFCSNVQYNLSTSIPTSPGFAPLKDLVNECAKDIPLPSKIHRAFLYLKNKLTFLSKK